MFVEATLKIPVEIMPELQLNLLAKHPNQDPLRYDDEGNVIGGKPDDMWLLQDVVKIILVNENIAGATLRARQLAKATVQAAEDAANQAEFGLSVKLPDGTVIES